MKLIFEKSFDGRGSEYLSPCDVPCYTICEDLCRESKLNLPEVSERDLSRHYTELAKRTFGLNKGFYPLGSCTMKYNPKISEEVVKLNNFTQIHPLQPQHTVSGCLQVLTLAEQYLCEITGMDNLCFQPAAGAHGEFTGMLLIKAYHESRNDRKRTKIIVPDSAHGTNPASAAMAGYKIVNIPSAPDGCVDTLQLKNALDDETAGLMLTNPNTLGLFDKNIVEITTMVHEAGGLNYYDGANFNAIMGIARPGDMGFDVVHLNLHKTFATPHGGGGPGSGPVGCKAFLSKFMPNSGQTESIGQVKAFYGNFLVVVRALVYLMCLGGDGVLKASQNAVLNANYMMNKLSKRYDIATSGRCMHEFVLSLERLKEQNGVTAMDIAKAMLDYRMHPPTMYFPLIVHEALMIEPTETESKDTLDEAVTILLKLYDKALNDPQSLKNAPNTTEIQRPDEVSAARNPILKYNG